MKTPLVELGGRGPRAIFLPATGFPLRCYRLFFDRLRERLSLAGIRPRPMWPDSDGPTPDVTWATVGNDLLDVLGDEADAIVIGHSLGASAAILAAAQHSTSFDHPLVMIEPASLSARLAALQAAIPYRWRRFFNPAAATLKRPDRWPNRKAFEDHARRNPVYRKVRGAAFDALCEGLTTEAEGAVQLAFSKEWEAHFYMTATSVVRPLGRTTNPLIGVRAAPSIFMSDSLWQALQRARPDGTYRLLPEHGHLLPLEAPEICADAVLESLSATVPRF